MRLLSPLRGLATLGASFGVAALTATSALGQALERIGVPVDGGMGFQRASSTTAVEAQWLDQMILIIITAITVFVTLLLL